MPLFSDVTRPAATTIASTWLKLFPSGPRLTLVKEEDSLTQFDVDGKTLMAMHIPAPVPGDEALHAIESSWMWQRPPDAVKAHRAHAIVTAMHTDDPLGDAWNVVRLSAALLESGNGAALYWGNARQVHAPDLVTKFATGTTLPVPLWVGVTISGQSQTGPFSAATHGIEALGQRELEVVRTKMPVGDLRMTLLDLTSYILKRGPVLLDGQTFGPDAETIWKIRHVPSELVPGRNVVRLEIP
jgi:hypothetical protein